MKTFLCPYCKKLIGAEPHGVCPHCHKGILIPSTLRRSRVRVRKQTKEQIRRTVEREKSALFRPDISAARPVILLAAMALLILTGVTLVLKARIAAPGATTGHRIDRAHKELHNLRIAVERFRRDCGRYPSTEEGLTSLFVDPGVEGWSGIYVTRIKPDPWLTPYQYAVSGTNITLYSFGPDKRPRTDDDLVPATPTPEEVTPPARPAPPTPEERARRMRFPSRR
jgi:general secretion pathway protein G